MHFAGVPDVVFGGSTLDEIEGVFHTRSGEEEDREASHNALRAICPPRASMSPIHEFVLPPVMRTGSLTGGSRPLGQKFSGSRHGS